MLEKTNNLEKALMSESEVKEEIFKDFATLMIAEVEKLIKKIGKEEAMKLINKQF